MKIVLGVAGKNGSGKETVVTALKNAAAKYLSTGIVVESFRSSDIIFECLGACAIEKSRHNAQEFVRIMESVFGKGFLSRAMEQRLLGSPREIAVFDGVRLMTDYEMLRSLSIKNPEIISMIVYVFADPKERFKRRKIANEKAGESGMEWDQFLKEDGAYTEQQVQIIGEKADAIFDNNHTKEILEGEVEKFFKYVLLPLLDAGE